MRAWTSRSKTPQLRAFFYLPFMHSEFLADQERSVLLNQSAHPDNLRFAQHHRDIVLRFGRFPHRNAALGRRSDRRGAALPRRGRILRAE